MGPGGERSAGGEFGAFVDKVVHGIAEGGVEGVRDVGGEGD